MHGHSCFTSTQKKFDTPSSVDDVIGVQPVLKHAELCKKHISRCFLFSPVIANLSFGLLLFLIFHLHHVALEPRIV